LRKFEIELKWAVAYNVLFILWTAMEKALGWHDSLVGHQLIYTNLFLLAVIPVYVLAIRDKRKNYYHGQISWAQGFISGTVMSVFAAIINPVALSLAFQVISPDYFHNISAYYIAHHHFSPEKAAQYFSLKSYIIQNTSSGISSGVLFSALIALAVKTKPL
jgi:hypothetical protein